MLPGKTCGIGLAPCSSVLDYKHALQWSFRKFKMEAFSELGMDRDELLEYISANSSKSKEGRNRETDPDELEQEGSFVEFQNQQSCEPYIRKVSRHAKEIKVLTIRGDKYFVGSKSLLHGVMEERSSTIEVLVLSPESGHITEELARKLQHNSPEEIRVKMRRSLGYLKDLARWHENFNVKCYNEEPNFKLLIFDDVMFVSSFAHEVPKNDQNAEMFMIRVGNSLFAGFEKLFDELSRRYTRLCKWSEPEQLTL